MTTETESTTPQREQQQRHGGAGSEPPRSKVGRKGRSVPPCNANDDILSADDRAALDVVLADQEKAKLEPAERLERHFRAGHFILRGDAYAIRKTNGAMGKVYARAAGEWIRASGIDRHPLLRRPATRTNLRKMAKNETGVRVWFFGTPERDDLGNEWPSLDIDEQTKIGHPDKIWEHFHDFLSAIFTAASFVSTVEDRQDAIAAKAQEAAAAATADEAIAEQESEVRAWWEEQQKLAASQQIVEFDTDLGQLLHLSFDEVRRLAPVSLLSGFQQAKISAVMEVVKKVEAEVAAERAEAERKRQEQAERKKAENRRNHLVEFNEIARLDIDRLRHSDWEKKRDPIKAERKAIEQLDGDLRWLESSLLCGRINLPALIRGLRKDETARVELLERLETWAKFFAGLREKLTTTPPTEPPQPPANEPPSGPAQPTKAEADAKKSAGVLSGENAAGGAGAGKLAMQALGDEPAAATESASS
jgi:hypothetical protein